MKKTVRYTELTFHPQCSEVPLDKYNKYGLPDLTPYMAINNIIERELLQQELAAEMEAQRNK